MDSGSRPCPNNETDGTPYTIKILWYFFTITVFAYTGKKLLFFQWVAFCAGTM